MNNSNILCNGTLNQYTSGLDSIGNISTQKWQGRLFDKQYENGKELVNRRHIAMAILRQGRFQRYESFQGCHRLSREVRCKCVKRFVPFSCNDRLCTICSHKTMSKYNRLYRKRINSMKMPRLISLGIGHFDEIRPEVITYWRKRVASLMRMVEHGNKRLGEKPVRIRSSLVLWEFSPNLYFHFHIIADMAYISKHKLSEMWMQVSRGLYIVDIQLCSRSRAFGYVLKYCAKPPEFESTKDYIFYSDVTRSRRRLSTTGELFRLKKSTKVSQKFLDGESVVLSDSNVKVPCTCRSCNSKVFFSPFSYFVYHDWMADVWKEEEVP